MSKYIRIQTAGQIIRNSYSVYWTHFRVLSLVFILPMLPFSMLLNYIELSDDWHHLRLGGQLLSFFMALLASAAMAIAISDISLGNQPSVIRSWRAVLGPLAGKLLATYLLVILWLIAGLGIFSLVFLAWFMFALTVVALEKIGGADALRRSKELGKGMYLRIIGVYFLLVIVTSVYYLLVHFRVTKIRLSER